MKTTIDILLKAHTFFTKIHKPFYESFILWLAVMEEQEQRKYLWQDISFFHLYKEDFFEWYSDENFSTWLGERLK